MAHFIATRSNRSSRRNAFTLIELLVVIAIIGVIASILFPVFAQARERARRTACASNLKQLGLAYLQYAQDYDEKLLPGFKRQYTVSTNSGWNNPANMWYAMMQPYAKSEQVLFCPSAKNSTYSSYVVMMAGYDVDYDALPPVSINGYIGNVKIVSLASAARPSESIFMLEDSYGDTYTRPDARRFLSAGGYVDMVTYDWKTYYPGRHQDGHNLLYVDGHVKWGKPGTLKNRNFYLNEAPGADASAAIVANW